MVKYSKVIFSILTFGLISIFSTMSVQATVGGPSYVSDISYDKETNSVYYLKYDGGGRGCPPIAHKINLSTGLNSEVISCEKAFEQYIQDYSKVGEQEYNTYLSDLFLGFETLSSIDLVKNNITIDVNIVSTETQYGELYWTDFKGKIKQDGKDIVTLDFRGCNSEQSHIFAGYMVPGTNYMALVKTNIGDCMEGGYTDEELYIVNGVKFYDQTIMQPAKHQEENKATKGNLSVSAKDNSANSSNPIKQDNNEQPQSKKYMMSPIEMGIYSFFAVLILAVMILALKALNTKKQGK